MAFIPITYHKPLKDFKIFNCFKGIIYFCLLNYVSGLDVCVKSMSFRLIHGLEFVLL